MAKTNYQISGPDIIICIFNEYWWNSGDLFILKQEISTQYVFRYFTCESLNNNTIPPDLTVYTFNIILKNKTTENVWFLRGHPCYQFSFYQCLSVCYTQGNIIPIDFIFLDNTEGIPFLAWYVRHWRSGYC